MARILIMRNLSGSFAIHFPKRPYLVINIAGYGRDCTFIFPLAGVFRSLRGWGGDRLPRYYI